MMTDLSHLTESVSRSAGEVAIALTRPHVLMRPALSLDGNMYCALYGENIMEGCAGFGESHHLPRSGRWRRANRRLAACWRR